MRRLSLLTLIFAILSVVFSLLLILFRFPFAPYPLMSVQDAVDILTPLALIPVYWLLFRFGGREGTSWVEDVVFMLLAAVWVEGQGVHLSANSINNLAEGLAKQQVLDILGTPIYELTYFFDEYLSHYLWHIGIVGLAALLIAHEWRRPAGVATVWGLAIPAGIIYGFTWFCIFVEGKTVPLGLPFVVIVAALGLIWGRRRLATQPILAFFFVTSVLAVVLFAGWGIYFRGFPEFSDVGLI